MNGQQRSRAAYSSTVRDIRDVPSGDVGDNPTLAPIGPPLTASTPPNLITLEQAREDARREFDQAEREIQAERNECLWSGPPPSWLAQNRRRLGFLALGALIAVLGLLFWGGAP